MKKQKSPSPLSNHISDQINSELEVFENRTREERPLVLEALEPRILFSGSPAPAPEGESGEAAAAQEAPAPAPELEAQVESQAVEAVAPEASLSTPPEASTEVGTEVATTVALNEADVAAVAQAAAQRWADSGISAEQSAALASITYQIADLSENRLGAADGNSITIDIDGAGAGWFVDSTPDEDSEFVLVDGALVDQESTKVDLLSIILHEQGHVLGLLDIGTENDLMNGVFVVGERRLPSAGQAAGAYPGTFEGIQYATLTWVGGGANGNWTEGPNWQGGTPPDDAGDWDTFEFSGTSQLNSNNNAGGNAGGHNVDDIFFLAGAGAFTITDNGDGFDMLGAANSGAADDTARIVNNSTNTQTIDVNLVHRSDFNTGLVFDAASGDLVILGNILNQGGSTDPVTITGPNTVTFGGNNNTYADPTVVNAGATLKMDGVHTTGAAYTVNGTLTGNGLVGSDVNSTGSVRPGDHSVGTTGKLKIAGNVDLGAGSLDVRIDGANDIADVLEITGNLDISAATLNLSELSAANDASYVIATYSGTLTGADFASIVGMPAGYSLDYSVDGVIKITNGAPEAAGVISWSAVVLDTTAGDSSPGVGIGDAAVTSRGTLIEAANFGSGDDVTVNGVLFQGVNLAATNFVITQPFDDDQGIAVGSTTGGDIDTLTSTLAKRDGDPTSPGMLTGLISGHYYEVQLLGILDGFDRTMTFDDGAGNAIVTNSDVPQEWVTGRFIASGTTQALNITSSTGSSFVNAYQLRDVTDLVGGPVAVDDVYGGGETLIPVADSYVQSNQTTANFGNADELRIKYQNDSAGTFNRKAYIRYDLSSLSFDHTTDLDVATLRLNFVESGAGTGGTGIDWEFEVYGLVDGDAGENWIEGNGGTDNNPAGELDWSNAPANNTAVGNDVLGNAVSLGTFVLNGKTGVVDFSSAALKSFIEGSTSDDQVTFIILRNTPEPNGSNTYVHTLASKEDGVDAPTQLILTSGVTDENTPVVVGAPSGVLNNDTPGSATVVGDSGVSANGAAVGVNGDGSFTYDPTGSAAIQNLIEGETLEDTFTYTITSPVYSQDFDFPDGTTNLGDGTTVEGAGVSVQGGQIRIIRDGVANDRGAFRIPAVADSSLGWTASFDLTFDDPSGGNQPADGVSFSYGDIPASGFGGTNLESGWGGGVNHITYGFNVNLQRYQVLTNSGANATSPNGSLPIGAGGSTTLNVVASWDPTDGMSLTVNGVSMFSNVATGFTGNDAYTFAIGGRTGGRNVTALVDNLNISTTTGPTDTATVTVTVAGVDNPPVANDDSVVVDEDNPVVIPGDLLANDSDPDGPTKVIDFTDFTAAASQLDLVGTAILDGPDLELTQSAGNQNGAAWFSEKIDVSRGFDTMFDFEFANPGNGGADGISFVVQNTAAGTTLLPGETGQGISGNGLIIEIDSWNNGGVDPNAAHISVRSGGADGDILATIDVSSIIGSGDFSGTGPHSLQVTYAEGDLDVFLNGNQIVTDLAVTFGAGQFAGVTDSAGKAYVGFGARTGGANETATIHNWMLEIPGDTLSIAGLRFDGFNNAITQMTLNGSSALVDGKTLQITNNTTNQQGSAWVNDKQFVEDGFVSEFTFNFPSKTGTGADGLAFTIHNNVDGTSLLPGVTSGGNGETGPAEDDLTIGIRSYDANMGVNSFIEVRGNGTNFSLNNGIGFDISESGLHTLRIEYVSGDLDVFLDGVQIITDLNVDLASLGAVDANGEAYIGFSARTGGQAEFHNVLDWSFSANKTTTLTSGAEVTQNTDGSFTYSPVGGNIDALDDGDQIIDTFTYTITDGVTGERGFDTATVTITVNGLNDAPVLDAGKVQAFGDVAINDFDNDGDSVFDLLNKAVDDATTDVDASALSRGIAIIGETGTGHFEYSTDGGGLWTDVAATASNALLLLDSALVRYVPDGTNSTPGSLIYRAWDQSTTDVQGDRVDLSAGSSVGGTTAFSADTATSTVVVANVVIEGDTLYYGATNGQENRVQFSVDGSGNLVIKDLNGHALTGSVGVGSGSNMIMVPLASFTNLNVDTGDENDIIDVLDLGSFGGDLLIDGMGGNDIINYSDTDLVLGAGNSATFLADTINALNGSSLTTAPDGAIDFDADRNVRVVGGTLTAGSGGLSIDANDGGATSGNFRGIDLTAANLSTTDGGGLSLNGSGGDAGGFNTGVYLYQSDVNSSGQLDITGQGGPGGNLNQGVSFVGGVYVATGDVNVTGTGAGTGSINGGIAIDAGATISSTGGMVTLSGEAGAGVTNNVGVSMNRGGSISGQTGVAILGTGAGSGSNNRGVYLTNNASIDAGTGALVISGTGSTTASGNFNVGVELMRVSASAGTTADISGLGGTGSHYNKGTVLSSFDLNAGGDVTIAGVGGDAIGNANVGLSIGYASSIVSGGAVVLTGTATGGVHFNAGVSIAQNSSVVGNGISVTGNGAGTGSYNAGVQILSATLDAGAGALNIDGAGSPAGTGVGNHGVEVRGGSLSGSSASAINGTGGGGTNGFGAFMTGVGGNLMASNVMTDPDTDDEKVGDFFNFLPVVPLLMAEADRRGRTRTKKSLPPADAIQGMVDDILSDHDLDDQVWLGDRDLVVRLSGTSSAEVTVVRRRETVSAHDGQFHILFLYGGCAADDPYSFTALIGADGLVANISNAGSRFLAEQEAVGGYTLTGLNCVSRAQCETFNLSDI